MSDFDVGFVIFPGITQLDFTGPFEVLSRLSTPHRFQSRADFRSREPTLLPRR
jgi:cyclohexyl-isocyanide hydratase